MKKYLKIHPSDSVAVALTPLKSGTVLSSEGESITLLENIPQGHKFALKDIPAGSKILKYGAPIGVAKESISKGTWIHTQHEDRTWRLTYLYLSERTL